MYVNKDKLWKIINSYFDCRSNLSIANNCGTNLVNYNFLLMENIQIQLTFSKQLCEAKFFKTTLIT